MTRKEANMEILRLIALEINQHPDQRFGQILRNLDVVDSYFCPEQHEMIWKNGFFEEPTDALERMRESMKFRKVK